MKKCPNCAVEMENTFYEGFGLNQCPSCSGHFVRKTAFEGIKRTHEESSENLFRDAQRAEGANSDQTIVCPGCFNVMDKELNAGFPKVEYDLCSMCHGVWFDPGELAMLQLVYEASQKGLTDNAMRGNFDDFMASKERQDRFKRNLAKCKDKSYTPLEAVSDGIFAGILHGILGCGRRFPW